jgi:hypothetical protein
MVRENEQAQRMKSQGEITPERKTPLASLATANSNIPLMSMMPTPASTANSSSAFYKDLTSTLFDQNPPPPPAQPFYGMTTSQTMPSLVRPTMAQQVSQPVRPTLNFSSSSKATDLTSSLFNNINLLASRPQTAPSGLPMNANPSTAPTYLNTSSTPGGALFQPPPPPGSTVIKGSITSSNVTRPKSAASELDDLFN